MTGALIILLVTVAVGLLLYVYDLKYRGRAEIGEYMGRIMARDLGREGFFEGIDVLVPVPVTRWRKWKRGYNQSFMIARGISDMTGLSVYDKVVKRTSFTVSQVGLSSGERRENVKGAFTLVDDKPIAHKHVLLVDDIVTTGSTVIACAQALQKAEDVRISVLSLGFTRS